jgi:hypothetical protein
MSSGCYSLAELQNGCPEGVDPTCKEQYLEDDTFQRLFGMGKEEFKRLQAWKRTPVRKKHGLF